MNNFSGSLLILLLGSALIAPTWVASAASPTIKVVVPGYLYPDAEGYNSTLAGAIANNGTIVGKVFKNAFGSLAFERFADGTYSAPIKFPGADFGTTVDGVNASDVVCGSFSTLLHGDHGFFYDGTTFTQYNVPGETGTVVTGLNDAGDFCGHTDAVAFVNLGGTLTIFTVPGAMVVYPRAVNNKGQVTGYYDGVLAGTASTRGGTDEGFVLQLPDQFTLLKYPGAGSGVKVTGINNAEVLAGSYLKRADRNFYSIIAKVVR